MRPRRRGLGWAMRSPLNPWGRGQTRRPGLAGVVPFARACASPRRRAHVYRRHGLVAGGVHGTITRTRLHARGAAGAHGARHVQRVDPRVRRVELADAGGARPWSRLGRRFLPRSEPKMALQYRQARGSARHAPAARLARRPRRALTCRGMVTDKRGVRHPTTTACFPQCAACCGCSARAVGA